MPGFGEAIGSGQKEIVRRDERTNPLTIVRQAVWLAIVAVVGFGIVRAYIYYWDWIGRRGLHGTLGPIAGICVLVCVIADIVLLVELFDPNWPNPRKAISSTQVLTPLSKERGGGGEKTIKIDRDTLLDLLDALEEDEE